MTARAISALCQLLQTKRPEDALVAWSRDGERRWSDLRLDVASLCAALRAAGARPGGSWILVDEDGYGFAVGLLALWHAGCAAVLPPTAQAGALEPLRERVDGALGGGGERSPLEGLDGVPQLAPFGHAPADPGQLAPLDRDQLALELFTSGTTGEGKAIPKRMRHLEDEVFALEALWGEVVGDARVFATASHQHLYGLLFRVLWPLASGRAFCADTLLHAEELLPRMQASGEAGCALASVPAHLRRLAARKALERAGDPLRAACRAVFSSGGPLAQDTAARWRSALGHAPREVFGSTETGGVAWRQQGVEPEDPWTPFPGARVRASEDGERVVAHSPFVSVGDAANGFRMGDRIALRADGRFTLLGRADRVLKIGEKRLDLGAMESRLRAHPAVDAAALVGVERAGQTRVGAVLVPSEEGRELLSQGGRRTLSAALGEHLAREWDPVLLPRYWRTTHALPEDSQGKTPAAALLELFDEAAGERPRAPELLAEERDAKCCERRLRVPTDLATLEGHFPGRPLVAGVVQLGWAVEAIGALLGSAPRIAGVEALKFREVLQPGDEATLRVELDPARAFATFRLWQGERVFSSGRLLLREAER